MALRAGLGFPMNMQIKTETIADDDLFLLLACDGVFDVLDDQTVINTASKHWGDPEAAATAVVRAAFQKGSEDNLTAMVIQFGWHEATGEKKIEEWQKAEAERVRQAKELVEEIDMFA